MLLEKERPVIVEHQVDSSVSADDVFSFVLGGIKRGLRSLLIAILLGTIAGVAYYFFKKPVYSSQMMGYTETLKKEVVFNAVDDLQKLIDQQDYDQLKYFLNLSEQKVKSIVELKAKAALEKSIYDTEESNIFIIEAKVNDLSVLDSLSYGIGYYVDHNEYVQIRLNKERESIKNSISKMSVEIKDLEELKVDMREALSKNTYRTNLFLSDIGYSSSKIVELYEKQNTLLNKLEFLFEIKVLRDFVKFRKKKEPRLLLSVITFQSFAIFILLAYWALGRFVVAWKTIE